MASNTPPPGRRQDRDRLLLRAHAHRFAEAMAAYRADHPVALREAHRLLDTRMRREAILSCIHDIERRAGKAPRRGIYGRLCHAVYSSRVALVSQGLASCWKAAWSPTCASLTADASTWLPSVGAI